MKKMQCRRYKNLNYDHFTRQYENDEAPICGLHGRARVDPDGPQQNLDGRGGCGFIKKNRPVELTFAFV